jgi:Fe-S-cluster containining protein
VSDVLAKRALGVLYAELPTIDCQRQCFDSCGPIWMSRVEWQRIVKRVGREPRGGPDLVCPMLRDRACTVYSIRPLICRLWGVCEGLECPWGCQPEPRYLSKAEAYDFVFRAELASARTDQERAALEAERARLRTEPALVSLASLLIESPVKTR